MELAGDEKRIQALFSESALRDQSAAPTFDELWLSATTKRSASVCTLNKSMLAVRKPLLAVTAVLLIAAASWAAWSWSRSSPSSPQQAVNMPPQPVSPETPAFEVVQQKHHVATDLPFKLRSSRQSHRRIRQPERSAITEAALLSRWRSPTEMFIKSPATVDFNSLPQLNQSAEELKQFLPRNIELTKESNQ
jgi:hypothetical protein